MNRFAVKLVGAAVLASSVLTAVAPAEARHRHHRHRDRVDAGDVIAGIFLIGAIAAIADSAKKSKQRTRERDQRDDDYHYVPPREDYRAVPDDARERGWAPGRSEAENRAADACSWAAEGDLGDDARVGQIDTLTRGGDGWRVTGNVAAPGVMPRDFACTYRDGRVVDVSFPS